MRDKMNHSSWIYIIVLNPGKNEKILGQNDHANSIFFIPIFQTKTSAEKNITLLSIKKKDTYEIQAMIYEDILKYAHSNDYMIFVISENGKIEDRLMPEKNKIK